MMWESVLHSHAHAHAVATRVLTYEVVQGGEDGSRADWVKAMHLLEKAMEIHADDGPSNTILVRNILTCLRAITV